LHTNFSTRAAASLRFKRSSLYQHRTIAASDIVRARGDSATLTKICSRILRQLRKHSNPMRRGELIMVVLVMLAVIPLWAVLLVAL
jgi:hypothetical protein